MGRGALATATTETATLERGEKAAQKGRRAAATGRETWTPAASTAQEASRAAATDCLTALCQG